MRWTLICAVLVGLALLLQEEWEPAATARTSVLANGSLSLLSSPSGSAILTADNLAPGDSTGGSGDLTNTGTLPGSLALAKAESDRRARARRGTAVRQARPRSQ